MLNIFKTRNNFDFWLFKFSSLSIMIYRYIAIYVFICVWFEKIRLVDIKDKHFYWRPNQTAVLGDRMVEAWRLSEKRGDGFAGLGDQSLCEEAPEVILKGLWRHWSLPLPPSIILYSLHPYFNEEKKRKVYLFWDIHSSIRVYFPLGKHLPPPSSKGWNLKADACR